MHRLLLAHIRRRLRQMLIVELPRYFGPVEHRTAPWLGGSSLSGMRDLAGSRNRNNGPTASLPVAAG